MIGAFRCAAVLAVAAMLAGCRSSETSEAAGVESVNGVKGEVEIVAGDSSVTVSANAASNTVELRSIEADPIFATSVVSGIAQSDIDAWDAAASFAEADPLFTAAPAASILAADLTDWTTAYNWGDHSMEGYLTAEANNTLTCAGSCVSLSELDFDPATQAELNSLGAQIPTTAGGALTGTYPNPTIAAGAVNPVTAFMPGTIPALRIRAEQASYGPTFDPITFDTEVLDRGNLFTTAAPTDIVIPISGIYHVDVTIRAVNAAPGSDVMAVLWREPAEMLQQQLLSNANGGGIALVLTGVFELQAGDILKVYVTGDPDGWDVDGSKSWFSLHWVGP